MSGNTMSGNETVCFGGVVGPRVDFGGVAIARVELDLDTAVEIGFATGGSSNGTKSGRSSSNTLLPAVGLVGVVFVDLAEVFESVVSGGASRNSSWSSLACCFGSVDGDDVVEGVAGVWRLGCVAFGSFAIGAAFGSSGTLSVSQSSSSLFVSTMPGTRMGDAHLGHDSF